MARAREKREGGLGNLTPRVFISPPLPPSDVLCMYSTFVPAGPLSPFVLFSCLLQKNRKATPREMEKG
ncbi:hypothetical protein VTH06DRAFT_8573 [Thermothelomyces fergusii]